MTPDRRLIDEDHVGHELGAFELAMGADAAIPVALGALQRRVDHVVHQRALAGSADAGHRGQHPERNLDVDPFQVVLARAEHLELLIRRLAAHRRHRNGQLVAQVLGRQRARLEQQRFERARKHHPSALLAGAEAHVNNDIGHADHVGVVLHDEDGVALIAQLTQDRDQPLVVPRMEPDRWLVEDIERVDQGRPQRRREVDALRFTTRERRRQAVERQIVESHVAQKTEPLANLAHDLVGHRRILLRKRQVSKEPIGLAHRQRTHPIDRLSTDLDVARLAPQPCAKAVRARQVAAIAAQEDAHMDLVFLPLEPAEEPFHTLVLRAVAFDDESPLVVGQLRPGHVEAKIDRLGRALQLDELGAIVRFAPRFDRVLIDRFRGVRHDQVHVELDDVAEPVTDSAGAKWIVEREEARLRHFVLDGAVAALEALAEAVHDGRSISQLDGKARTAAFRIGRLDGVGEPRAQIAVDLDAIDNHLQHRTVFEDRRIDLLERKRLTVDIKAAKAFAPQRGKHLGDRVHHARQARLPRIVFVPALVVRLFASLPTVETRRGCGDDGHVEADEEPGACG